VTIHTNRTYTNNQFPNTSHPNGSTALNSYPTENLGYTGQNYNQAYLADPNINNTNASSVSHDVPPRYEDLSILPPQSAENKPPSI